MGSGSQRNSEAESLTLAGEKGGQRQPVGCSRARGARGRHGGDGMRAESPAMTQDCGSGAWLPRTLESSLHLACIHCQHALVLAGGASPGM